MMTFKLTTIKKRGITMKSIEVPYQKYLIVNLQLITISIAALALQTWLLIYFLPPAGVALLLFMLPLHSSMCLANYNEKFREGIYTIKKTPESLFEKIIWFLDHDEWYCATAPSTGTKSDKTHPVSADTILTPADTKPEEDKTPIEIDDLPSLNLPQLR